MGFAGVNEKILRVLQDAAQISRLEGTLAQTGLEAKWLYNVQNNLTAKLYPRIPCLFIKK